MLSGHALARDRTDQSGEAHMLDRNILVLWCVWYRGHVHDFWVLPFECDEYKRACFLPSWSMHISPNEGRA